MPREMHASNGNPFDVVEEVAQEVFDLAKRLPGAYVSFSPNRTLVPRGTSKPHGSFTISHYEGGSPVGHGLLDVDIKLFDLERGDCFIEVTSLVRKHNLLSVVANARNVRSMVSSDLSRLWNNAVEADLVNHAKWSALTGHDIMDREALVRYPMSNPFTRTAVTVDEARSFVRDYEQTSTNLERFIDTLGSVSLSGLGDLDKEFFALKHRAESIYDDMERKRAVYQSIIDAGGTHKHKTETLRAMGGLVLAVLGRSGAQLSWQSPLEFAVGGVVHGAIRYQLRLGLGGQFNSDHVLQIMKDFTTTMRGKNSREAYPITGSIWSVEYKPQMESQSYAIMNAAGGVLLEYQNFAQMLNWFKSTYPERVQFLEMPLTSWVKVARARKIPNITRLAAQGEEAIRDALLNQKTPEYKISQVLCTSYVDIIANPKDLGKRASPPISQIVDLYMNS